MSKLEIHQISCLSDNYGYLIHDPEADTTATIDTPEVGPIEAALRSHGWELTHILNTHHHADHAGGNLELQEKTGCAIIGPRDEADKIPGIEKEVGDGDTFLFGTHEVRVMGVPGHTLGHIAYYFEDRGVAFVGDALFALGCGRVFEGTPDQMWSSLEKLMALPDDTGVYCAHEYTQANAKFAATIEPGNADLTARIAEIDKLRGRGEPTVPTTIGLERRTNPFVRPSSEEIQKVVGLAGATPAAIFTEVRHRKDNF
jgi:hydroxyacylglutathione hydrolase